MELMKIYFGLGWPSSNLEIVSMMKINNKQQYNVFFLKSVMEMSSKDKLMNEGLDNIEYKIKVIILR